MGGARITALARELENASLTSAHLELLRSRFDVTAAHEALEREIVHEMASALGRTEDALLTALVRLDLADQALAHAATDDERARRLDAREARRQEALRARHDLLVHREAVGLRRNEMLERLYPIPPARRS